MRSFQEYEQAIKNTKNEKLAGIVLLMNQYKDLGIDDEACYFLHDFFPATITIFESDDDRPVFSPDPNEEGYVEMQDREEYEVECDNLDLILHYCLADPLYNFSLLERELENYLFSEYYKVGAS